MTREKALELAWERIVSIPGGNGYYVRLQNVITDLMMESRKPLIDALRAVEWSNPNTPSFRFCHLCDQLDSNGHSPDCLVGKALEGE